MDWLRSLKCLIQALLTWSFCFEGDALSYHNGMRFTTFDQDNDEVSNKNCANQNHGGWWYRSCFRANLNGRYFSKGGRDFSGIIWFEWGDVPTPKKAVEMKIRPIR